MTTEEILLLIIAVGVLTAMFVVAIVSLVKQCRREKKRKERDRSVSKGDILLYNHDEENPFRDNEWNYDLVTETRVNKDGRVYFISQKCNIDGVLAPKGNYLRYDNTSGLPFNGDLYTIVNHIDL